MHCASIVQVSDAVPMKRELKASNDVGVSGQVICFRRCPYEEGTESDLLESTTKHLPSRFRRCPYEEGTERTMRSSCTSGSSRFRRCPYEEGTERHLT